ncbi:MAG: tripartite tricarboxylate transporter substrate binding protein [Alcaligenaceae bacterium]
MNRLLALLLTLLSLSATSAQAQEFPNRPLRIITPYAAGGGIDLLTRTVAQRLGQFWNQQVIVENRPGAGATIGYAAAAKAQPDGYTLVAAANPLGIGPVVYPNLAYDVHRDFMPIGLLATAPEVLTVTASSPYRSVADLVKAAKQAPRPQNFGSAGSGTLAHLAAESFNTAANLDAQHVAYKGSSPALADLLGGQIDWIFDSPAAIMSNLQAVKLRALASAAPERSPQLPTVPTMAEAGFPNLDFRIWLGLMAPAGTPTIVIGQIETAIATIMKDPSLRKTLEGQGWDIAGTSAKSFEDFLKTELPKLAQSARAAKVKAD